jgi:MSHA biogenesis protein MshI
VDLQGGVFGVSVQMPGRKGEKPLVLAYDAFEGQTVVDGSVLAQLGRAVMLNKFATVALLGRQQYQIFMVDKPAVRSDEMQSSLRLVVSSLIDYPIADASLGWLEIPVQQSMGGRVPQLYTAVAKTEHVQACAALFEQARIRLDAVDIRESAQRNISFLLESDGAATCLIHANSDGVQLTVTFKREVYLVRFIGETFADKTGPQSQDQLQAAVARLALEIHRSLDFVRRNYPSLNLEALHVAPTTFGLDLAALLQPQLGMEVKSLDLGSVFDFPADSGLVQAQVQAKFFNALGAALRIDAQE